MIYVSIGLFLMYNIVRKSKEIGVQNFTHLPNASLINLFLVGMLWPLLISCAIVKSIIETYKVR